MRVGGTGVLGAVKNFRDPHTGAIATLVGRSARGVAIDQQGNNAASGGVVGENSFPVTAWPSTLLKLTSVGVTFQASAEWLRLASSKPPSKTEVRLILGKAVMWVSFG